MKSKNMVSKIAHVDGV